MSSTFTTIYIFSMHVFSMCFSTLSFYLGLTACSSTSTVSPTIVLEYSIGGGPFIIMQVLVVNGTYVINIYCIVTTMKLIQEIKSFLCH